MKGTFKRLLRSLRFRWQRLTRGWDDSETWDLNRQLTVWLAPRLRRFKELNNGFPSYLTEEEWNIVLEEMIWAAEWYAENAYNYPPDGELKWDRALEGLKLVTLYLNELWW